MGTKGIDEAFNVARPEKLDTVKANEHKLIYQVMANEAGNQYLRGYADNYKITEVKGDTVTTVAHHIYFEYPFFVKKK